MDNLTRQPTWRSGVTYRIRGLASLRRGFARLYQLSFGIEVFSMSRSQRKQNYVDSHVQGALLRRICMHWVIFFVVNAMAIIMLQTLLGDPAKTVAERIRLETGEFAFMAVVMLSLFPAFMLDTIRFSNRFVGPIGRLRRFLRDLGSGSTDHCTFRNNDFWSEMSNEFNNVADMVAAQKAEIEDLKNQLEEAGIRS